MAFVCISIGSNLNQPSHQVEKAIDLLAAMPATTILKRSKLYETEPWGVTDQPAFINSIASLETNLQPIELLDEIQTIELAQGRVRGEKPEESKWGPRVLDLDIICYDQLSLDTTRLKLPHPYFSERVFVLEPLTELCPNLSISGKTATQWLNILNTKLVEKLNIKSIEKQSR